jgi:hypothetical protein
MGAVFAFASAGMTAARPETVASGMRITFAVAGVLAVAALVIAVTGVPRSRGWQSDSRGRKT